MPEPTENKTKFKGCYVATLTPFTEDYKLDTGIVREHTAWLVENGIAGLCPVGTTGEFLFLSFEEKQRVFKATLEAAAGKVPVLTGVWATDPAECVTLAKFAAEHGAAGVFLPTPIYYPVTQDAIFGWYAAVAEGVGELPVFAYNIPQYAANEIGYETLQRLFDAGLIAGVKDSTGKNERVGELVKRFGEDYTVFAASDSFASEGRKLGADGFISAIANVVPSLFVNLWNGDETLQAEVDSLRSTLKQFGSISALKFLLHRRGFPFNGVRIPFSSLTDEQKLALDSMLP